MNNIQEFIDLLVTEKGFSNQNEEVLAQIKSDLMSRFEDRVNAMIVTNLSPEKYEEFEKVLDANDQDATTQFIMSNIDGIEEKLAKEMLDFKSIYLG
jgi:uncharacterized Fe-S cluster-containing radical SAM superfamily protein